MPRDGWRTVRVSDLGRVVTGRTPPSGSPEWWGTGLPFLTPSDFDGSRSVTHVGRRLSEVGHQALSRVVVPHGVAVSCIGWQMGKTVLVVEPTVTNQQINTIVYDRDVVDGEFLYYVMRTRRKEIFRLGSSGSRTPIVKKSLFEELEVQLPPLQEQREIAAVLGTFDRKIELNRRTNRSLELLLKLLFRSWFVDFDPVTAPAQGLASAVTERAAKLFPKTLTETSEGPLPEGWRHERLGDVLTAIISGSRPTGGLGELATGVPSLGAEHVVPLGEFDYESVGYVSEEFAASMRRGHVQSGDVALYKDGAHIGRKTMWRDGFPFEDCVVNEHVFLLRARPEVGQAFLFLWLDLPDVTAEIVSLNANSAQPGLSQAALSDLVVPVPPADVMAEFNSIASPVLDRLFANAKQSRDLAKLRDGLMKPLVAGMTQAPSLACSPIGERL